MRNIFLCIIVFISSLSVFATTSLAYNGQGGLQVVSMGKNYKEAKKQSVKGTSLKVFTRQSCSSELTSLSTFIVLKVPHKWKAKYLNINGRTVNGSNRIRILSKKYSNIKLYVVKVPIRKPTTGILLRVAYRYKGFKIYYPKWKERVKAVSSCIAHISQ